MLSMIATVFSVLAGVLFAIISILGDPSMLMDQSWRYNVVLASETQRKIHRNMDIFVLYIIILIVIVIFGMTDAKSDVYVHLQRVCLFLVTLGFWASLWMPFSLKEIQRKRLNDAIDAKRNGQGG
ncbi:hypothetical protein C3941_08845 [Kaistia algarum]|nr:hypothetical protein C3941_08845 [Kaistia algarum]